MTQRNHPRRKMPRHAKAVVLTALGLLPWATRTAEAQCTGAGCPAQFEFSDRTIQKAPTHFKLQARVSQAKLPVGEAVFPNIEVRLKSGANQLCNEQFANVEVLDSVLNLEIGRGMTCTGGGTFADAIASASDTSFQVCIGGNSNCLKAISLASVPYAAKATYAYQAQVATEANTAAQCNYAHRVTADDDLFITKQTSDGYYEFHTPTPTEVLQISPQSKAGGFIQWTPVGAENVLHLCGRDAKGLRNLATLMLHAEETQFTGDAVIAGRTVSEQGLQAGRAPADANVTADGNQTLVVYGSSLTAGPATVRGPLTAASAQIMGNATMASGKVTGDFVVDGTARVTALAAGAPLASTQGEVLTANGPSLFQGAVSASSVLVGPNASAMGSGGLLRVDGMVEARTLAAREISADSFTVGKADASTGILTVHTPAVLNQTATFMSAANFSKGAEFSGQAIFNSPVTFRSSVSLPSDVRVTSTNTDDLVAQKSVTVGPLLPFPVGGHQRPVELDSNGSAFFSGSVQSVGVGTFSSLSQHGATPTWSISGQGEAKFSQGVTALGPTGVGRFDSIEDSNASKAWLISTTGKVVASEVASNNNTWAVNAAGGGSFTTGTFSGKVTTPELTTNANTWAISSSGGATFSQVNTPTLVATNATLSGRVSNPNGSWSIGPDGSAKVAALTVTGTPECPPAPPGVTLLPFESNGTRACVYEVPAGNFDGGGNGRWVYAAQTCFSKLGAQLCTYSQAMGTLGWGGRKPNYWLADRTGGTGDNATALATTTGNLFDREVSVSTILDGAYCCLTFRLPRN